MFEDLITEGMVVRSPDGQKLGRVAEVQEDGVLIKLGIFFREDRLLRFDEIAGLRDGELWLSEEQPAAEQSRSRPRSVTVPVAEEQLVTEKRVRRSAVRVKKQVLSEEAHVRVPAVREQLVVERCAARREALPGEGAFERRLFAVPVRKEEVQLTRRPVVREEVRVRVERQTEVRRLDADVRREVVRVQRDDHRHGDR